MLVTTKSLLERHACVEGAAAFHESFPDGLDVSQWTAEKQLGVLMSPSLRRYISWAWDAEIIPRLGLHGLNLRWVDLSDANLCGIDLSESSLDHANLRGTNLARAVLTGASARGARLPGVNLTEAYASHANLYEADCTAAVFADCTLRNATMRRARLYYADLRGADLRGADLRLADLRGARFGGGCGKYDSILHNANLTGAIRDPHDPPIPGWRLIGGALCQA